MGMNERYFWVPEALDMALLCSVGVSREVRRA